MAPDSPYGYMMLATHHWQLAYLGISKSPQESLNKALKLAQKAVSMDDTNSWSHSLLSTIYLQMRQYDKAISEGERSVQLDPNGAFVHHNLGSTLCYADRVDEGIDHQKQAIRLNPFPPYYYYMGLSRCYRDKGQFEEALAEIKKSTQVAPNWWGNYYLMAVIYVLLDRQEEAATAAKKVLELKPSFSLEQFSKAWPIKNPAKTKIYIDAALKAGLPYTPPLNLPDKPSIAVLAFDNLSGDPEQEYFSDGISEELISALSKTDQLFVIARNSSFVYKGEPVNVKKVARELGVRYVLEGSVRKSEDRVRITAQLIDATTGHHMWSERYDRHLSDIFAVQDEITMKIITALQVELTEGEQMRIWAKRYKRLDVQLKAMELLSLWREGTVESHMRHAEVAQEVIDMAPELAMGYRTLGFHHWWLARIGRSPQENLKIAFALVQKALSLDETDAYTHGALGSIYLVMRQYEKAIEAGERAIELDPNGAEVHALLSQSLYYAGRTDEALGYINKAFRLNPFPPGWYFKDRGTCYSMKGQYQDALKEFKEALQRAPKAPNNYGNLAVIYILLDREEEARTVATKCMELAPWVSVDLISKIEPFKDRAYLEKILDAMRKAGFPEGA
ncbi:MAG: tetratricopeptide repeat protein [Deltaproteobacteria bacterium]|nr:tetratricopeptide repeat protein [Deltaproteobacteria bacterium]